MATYYYVRVSTNKQTTQNQVDAMRKVHAAPDAIYDDSGVSGKVPALKRPAFSEMMSTVQPGDRIVCFSISRIGRSAADTLTMVEDMQRKGVTLVSHTEGFDATTTMGKMMLTMLAGFAELEREQMIERINAGLDTARSNGVKLGKKVSPESAQASEMLANGATVGDVIAATGLSRAMVYRLKKSV
ncbi:recombinase family protein [Escherichia coli]|uniref:recombinase family protein n=1 Tax=Escherichia coli TaxID=562 RepID=UPI001CA757BA|nr:recombinase family protein [Escherichia coli]QZY67683.1 recombinase family protein [Escherichia coli]